MDFTVLVMRVSSSARTKRHCHKELNVLLLESATGCAFPCVCIVNYPVAYVKLISDASEATDASRSLSSELSGFALAMRFIKSDTLIKDMQRETLAAVVWN